MKGIELIEEIQLYDSDNKTSLVEYYSLKSKLRNVTIFFGMIFISWIIGNLTRISQQNSNNCPNENNSLCKCSFDCDNVVDILITISMGGMICGFIYLCILIFALCCLSCLELGISKE